MLAYRKKLKSILVKKKVQIQRMRDLAREDGGYYYHLRFRLSNLKGNKV